MPTIFLGLLFGLLFAVLAGLIPGGRFTDWLEWSPASTQAPVETTVRAQVTDVAAAKSSAATPAQTVAALSQNEPALAPEFVLQDLFDESVNRGLANYGGRPVILNFWASWCVPCKEEMPALQRAYEEHRNEGLVVLGLNQTYVDDLDAARDFVNDLILNFPNARDETGNTSKGLYQVMGLPTSVFITPDGEIAHKQIGQMTEAQIDAFSQQLVNGEAVGPGVVNRQ